VLEGVLPEIKKTSTINPPFGWLKGTCPRAVADLGFFMGYDKLKFSYVIQ